MAQFDELSICERCGSDACYSQEVNAEITSKYCFGCGFQTNSIMKVGSEFFEEQMAVLPELYKVLAGEDETGKVWMPSFRSDEQGMLFADGTGEDNWAWAAVRMVPVTEEDSEVIKEQKMKPDMANKKHFAEGDFMDALSYLGLLPNNEEENED